MATVATTTETVVVSKSKINFLKDRLIELERFYNSACGQLIVLNMSMERLTARYVRAEKLGLRTCRYSLRMRMAITEGVRNMFYEYATHKAYQISKVRQEILVEHAFSEESGDELDESYLGFDYYNGLGDSINDTDEEEDNSNEETESL